MTRCLAADPLGKLPLRPAVIQSGWGAVIEVPILSAMKLLRGPTGAIEAPTQYVIQSGRGTVIEVPMPSAMKPLRGPTTSSSSAPKLKKHPNHKIEVPPNLNARLSQLQY